ncbi:NADH dehydrogenase [ubiquinone] 1 alpha subcomplex subunit 10, mitochondrial isoform X2 [Leptopilina boulardi]|uniref:NADH dehydrogenase [ubiquinone] 1 alpha subcomplex subunit 10, mitochondrial isoform X2 n=1 Tax=Leptopilina boulardi TaxID=63433 RepID=UPI0021F510F5|nr:NADH dehydrogenase [ubiquinone] 1 alpha subcomplex subunit 10, mitochondrial isoform X2 [Leptopilina boulardi]
MINCGIHRTFKKGLSSTNNVPFIQVACISTREVRKYRDPRPPPFPYEKKIFGPWDQLFDNTIHRFDDNSKLIVVEGPPALGKGELCKQLANELEMLYVPQASLNDYYVKYYDFDLKTLDDKLPEVCKSCDLPTFFKNPTIMNGAKVQFLFYQLKFFKTLNILTHILSTGQGVITEGSVWSDKVFANVMNIHGYLSDESMKIYNTTIDRSLFELMRPHLCIYLDAPVSVVQEKIKKRNNPAEVNSKVLNEKFLSDLEYQYKFNFLKSLSEHSHILIYDYSNGGDFEVIIEDIETLNFDVVKNAKRFEDWDLRTSEHWISKRKWYSECEHILIDYATPEDAAPECRVPGNEALLEHEVKKEFGPRQIWDTLYRPFDRNRREKKLLR